jgi:hypothetical protein
MWNLLGLIQLLVGRFAVVTAEPLLSRGRVLMSASYGDIQLAFYPEVSLNLLVPE